MEMRKKNFTRTIYLAIFLILVVLCGSATAFEATEFERKITHIGDLPLGHDPSLVLKKGQMIKVHLFNSANITPPPSEGWASGEIAQNIYDSSNQFILVPKYANIHYYYRIYEEQGKIRIDIIVEQMWLDPYTNVSVLFSNPPLCETGYDRAVWLKTVGINNEEYDRWRAELRNELFLSPVMSAKLILDAENYNELSKRKADYKRSYRLLEIDLRLEKDILFSGPFIRDPRRDWGMQSFWRD